MFQKDKTKTREIESVFSLINIIFLLIVFFLVAGHSSKYKFEITPPKLQKAQKMNEKNCVLTIKQHSLYMNSKKIYTKASILKSLSKSCDDNVVLVSDKNQKAIITLEKIQILKRYFSTIKLLVTEK